MSTLARGVVGRLYAGYHVAARLGAWEVSMPDEHFAGGEWRLTAAVAARDDYWLAHAGAFGLELDVGPTRWRWPAVRVESTDPLAIRGDGKPEVSRA